MSTYDQGTYDAVVVATPPIAEPFFTPAEMLALQSAALGGMQSDITIYTRSDVAETITSPDDYGDDVEAYTEVTNTDTTPLVVKGWLFQRPTAVATEDVGQVVTVNSYRLYVPLGTPIRPGDEVRARDELGIEVSYVVADTNADITWKAWVTCSLRRNE